MTFDEAFELVIGHEGNYVNDPRDPGGETKYGVSKRSYPNLDIKNLTLDQAKEIYKRDFWDQCHINELPKETHFDVFDMAVNSGVKTSIKLIQRALKVDDDGIWGKITTAAALANKDGLMLSKRFNGHRLNYYADLKNFDIYGRGWTRRVAYNLINI